MNILVDAALPPRLARALQVLVRPDHSVCHPRDVLGNDASDRHLHDYLRSQPDVIVIGQDFDLIEHPHRLAALREWDRPVFLLSAAWLDAEPWTQAAMLIERLSAIVAKAAKASAPRIYLVPPARKGSIRTLA